MDDSGVTRWRDPVIEAYKLDVDRSLLRENLKRSVQERIAGLQQMERLRVEVQCARRSGHHGRF